LYFSNPSAYFVVKVGDCTKPSVEILATIIINFISFLVILFVTFEYYRNLAPDRQIKKHWLAGACAKFSFSFFLELK
jgi:hypothetical protein